MFGSQQKNLRLFIIFRERIRAFSGLPYGGLRPLVVATESFGELLASIDGEVICQAVRVLPILVTLKIACVPCFACD